MHRGSRARQQLCPVWWVRPGSGPMQRPGSSVHVFIHSKWGEQGKGSERRGRGMGEGAVAFEGVRPVTRQEKHEQCLASGEQDGLGHMSSLCPSTSESLLMVSGPRRKSYICS